MGMPFAGRPALSAGSVYSAVIVKSESVELEQVGWFVAVAGVNQVAREATTGRTE